MKCFSRLIIIALTFFSTSCADYLDIVPDDIATIEKSFNNRAAAERFFFTCYSYLPNPTDIWSSTELMTGDEIWWDIDQPNWLTNPVTYIAKGSQNANNPYLNYWDGEQSGKKLFVAIRDCNIFLENIDRVHDMEDYERKRWISEGKFLKA